MSGPCLGTAEPRALALEIEPRLVADDPFEGVVACIRTALAMEPAEREHCRRRAQELLERYSAGAFEATLRETVMPALVPA